MRYPAASWILLQALLYSSVGVDGFHLPLGKTATKVAFSSPRSRVPIQQSFAGERSSSAIYFWGNKDKKDETPEAEPANNNDDGEEKSSSVRESLVGRLPFFANKDAAQAEEPKAAKEEEAKPVAAVAQAPTPRTPPKPQEEMDPAKKAQALRAQAERARLEAEKMDAELTLAKITRLEKQMATAVAKDETDDVERLQREMDALQAKIRGETPPPVVVPPKPKAPKKEEEGEPKIEVKTSSSTPTITIVNPGETIPMPILKKIDEKDFESTRKQIEESPAFIKKLLAKMTEVDYETADDIDAKEVTKRMIQLQNFDYSFSNRDKPAFTQQEIDKAIQEKLLEQSNVDTTMLPEGIKGNATAEALLALEYNYYVEGYDTSNMVELLEGEDWLKDMIAAVNQTAIDSAIEVLYPKCTRKEDAPIPTLAQVNILIADVLPKASFTPRGKPEQVAGGYIVRGTSKFETGDETIAAIDEQMEKSPMLKDKMTILYTKDFTLVADQEENFDLDFPDPNEEPPILYIMGPNIVPERKRIALAATTSLGIATAWYLSVYPFLLNPVLLKRCEEQLELADASMAYDLSWLSELALPLFLTFMGIQLAHEAGHKLIGGVNGLSTTFPTFVPSLITGHTSAVTQFKEPPKNTEQLFDFAVAGPLCGILASLAALVFGSQLTTVSDPALLPALPLDILRQSTLGGGIIDAVLGAGALSVPPGAEATQAVAAMTVSLHPVAVAGYIGLIVNSLALLPIGTTDGGRIALALFGRQAKPFIGNIFLIMVFLLGFTGSDLFLFYFSFLVAFQTGNEIPARNEVDDISFPRVLVATATTVLAVLSLIPFQTQG